MPDTSYPAACIFCSSQYRLQMIAHRNDEGTLVAWIFACGQCAEDNLPPGSQIHLDIIDPVTQIKRALAKTMAAARYYEAEVEDGDESLRAKWEAAEDKIVQLRDQLPAHLRDYIPPYQDTIIEDSE